ncbi:unnamed protein product [Protopolystoma xenopodis]|uniref:Uncharacterized protein n=1 Tax=Protopolystoma xenopodis TaxID=117903 RepID=A0A3S5A952_9PLAT|nr:unnamed protein product [Protopolystoma xenopodis]
MLFQSEPLLPAQESLDCSGEDELQRESPVKRSNTTKLGLSEATKKTVPGIATSQHVAIVLDSDKANCSESTGQKGSILRPRLPTREMPVSTEVPPTLGKATRAIKSSEETSCATEKSCQNVMQLRVLALHRTMARLRRLAIAAATAVSLIQCQPETDTDWLSRPREFLPGGVRLEIAADVEALCDRAAAAGGTGWLITPERLAQK